MKAIVSAFHTDVYPTNEEVKAICKPGAGEHTCVWLVIGKKGWECMALHKNPALLKRWEEGNTVAKRNGCDRVRDFDPLGKMGKNEI